MGIFNWEDPFSLDDQLNEDERLVRESARTYAEEKLFTRVREANRDEFFHREIMNEMGDLGLLGPTLPEKYGCSNVNYVCYGLAAREVERVDSGYRSAMSVQSSLVMHPIFEYGSEEQRRNIFQNSQRANGLGVLGSLNLIMAPIQAAWSQRLRKRRAVTF